MNILDNQSQKMSQMCEDLQHGPEAIALKNSLTKLDSVLQQVEENTATSNDCLDFLL